MQKKLIIIGIVAVRRIIIEQLHVYMKSAWYKCINYYYHISVGLDSKLRLLPSLFAIVTLKCLPHTKHRVDMKTSVNGGKINLIQGADLLKK